MKYWYGYQTCIAYGIGKIEVPTIAESKRNARLIEESGVRALYASIIQLNTKGTQKDFRPLGEVFKRQRPMANDLHQENIGFWRKRPVVIDFGCHLVGEFA